MNDIVPSLPEHKRHRAIAEALLVYTSTIGLIVVLYQLRGIPLINSFLWTLAMLLQVYVPFFMLQRQGLSLAAYGLHTRQLKLDLRLWLLCCAVILPPTLIGHHIWQGMNHHKIATEAGGYRQFDYGLRGSPPLTADPNEVQIYANQMRPVIVVQWRDPLQGFIISDKPLKVVSGSQWIKGKKTGKRIFISGGGINGPANLHLRVTGVTVRFQLQRDGRPLPPYHLRFGPQRQHQAKAEVQRGFGWLLYLLVAQLLMVALPEELFYRGYLQTRLDDAFPVRYVWGIPLSWSNLITSVLFALTHYLIGFEPHRLSVFFPSLLFGALKHRTGSLLAPILFHATANIFIKLLEVWYV